jgi:Flp pilus assembly protein TadG
MHFEMGRADFDDRGAAAVEFALILPILLVIVLGIIQFGFTFTQWLEMEHAAREGARWGSLGYDSGAISTKAQAAAPGLDPTKLSVIVTPPSPKDHPSDPVTVTLKYDTPVFPIIGPIIGQSGPTMQLQATAVNRIE